MNVQGIRGAAAVDQDRPERIFSAAQELIQAVLEANPDLEPEAIASVIFTTTPDLTADYPARAAREMGWNHVPLLCTREMSVPEGLPRCIRVLIHWNTDLPQSEINHVYLGQAAQLRPDLAPRSPRRKPS